MPGTITRNTEKTNTLLTSFIPHKPFETTVVISRYDRISGLASQVEAHLVKPQTYIQKAANILVYGSQSRVRLERRCIFWSPDHLPQ
jgi:hypothetical protein